MPKFDKSARLRRRSDFADLKERGRRVNTPDFIIVSADSAFECSRLGITVSRKVGNAVARNRVKRLIREFFRNNRELFSTADYNIIARSGAVDLGYAAVCQELANGVCKIGQQSSH